ncbi:hypothetical protein BJV92_005379 [Clostridium beijerinckii]|nr:hypothetical protein [Clostridium beijerinckii]
MEEVNLSGTYLIRDDRYWMKPWRDSKRAPKEKAVKAKLSGKRTGDR